LPHLYLSIVAVSNPGRRPGEWLAAFQREIDERLRTEIPSADPLPTTREIGERYNVNASTVFRQLTKYEKTNRLWRSFSGRFYDARARDLIEPPRPIACLFRRIENWSFLYQEIMEGIASACESAGRATLLWHDERLVQQAEAGSQPRFASLANQKKSLESFLSRYGRGIDGLILDHAWSNQALEVIPSELRERSVIVCRPGPPDIASVHPDMLRNAGTAITQLLAQGCRTIHPVRPFNGDPAIDYTLASIQAAAASASFALGPELDASTAAARSKIIRDVSRKREPIGLISPEDNIAHLLAAEKSAAVAIISIQGTRHASAIPRIPTDYSALGVRAIAAITGSNA
jgi:DNA-binding LacI/PurR family transcriptional regulator